MAEADEADDASGDAGWQALQEIFSKPPGPIDFDKCDIALTIDYEKYQSKMGLFRDAWFYKDKPIEYYQRRGHKILAIIARKEATMITQAVFGTSKGPRATACRFRFFVTDQDQYGNDKPYVLVSWHFTAELARKVNWAKLDDQQFPKLAIDYRFGQEFLNRVRQDPSE